MAPGNSAASAPGRANGAGTASDDDRTPPRFAALDLGTNNCRLLIARPDGAYFTVMDAFSRNVRLGEWVEQTGVLSSPAMDRTIDALRVCAAKIRRHGVRSTRIVATEACRRAANGREFLARVRRETGLHMELITTEQEARLALAGCAPLLDPEAEHLMVFDIGGGSTELIWIDLAGADLHSREDMIMALAPGAGGRDRSKMRREARARVVDWISAPLGVATLHDKFSDVKDDRSRYALMAWFFEEHITGFGPYDDEFSQARIARLQIIGASGTVTTLGAIHKGLLKYDRTKVDGMWLATADVDRHVSQLINLGLEGRRAHPGVGPDRAQMVIAGAAILQTILRLWPVTRIRVADRGLREGLLYSQMWSERTRGA